MQPNRPTRGFTFIEVIIIMMIIGIFAAIAVPYASTASQSQLPAAMRILEADIAFAQAYNIAHQDSPCVIVFDQTTDGYRITKLATPDTPITHPGDKQPYVITYGQHRAQSLPSIRISSHTAGDDNQLGFGSMGQLDQTTAAAITLTDGHASMTITLDPITGLGTITRE